MTYTPLHKELVFNAPFDKLSKRTKKILNIEKVYLNWSGVVTVDQMRDFAHSHLFHKLPNFGAGSRREISDILNSV